MEYIWPFTVQPHLGVIRWTCLKMAGDRVKRSEIFDVGVLVTYIWGTFDLLVFRVILGPFSCHCWYLTPRIFLALLDSVSRAHGMGLLSVVRPSVSQLSLNLMYGFLSNFSCGFPWAIRPDGFWIFEKKFFLDFLRIYFVFVNMGPYGSKNFKMLLLLQIAAESFQTFPEFSY